ncbi:pyruvate dehydrogenase (acetyl-transferring), homodimeric type [Brachybacterium sp. NBEC-018]|uniref:pyruvate dehydrogenase (acetyl-transferring), homodimeric type n=1 Tax=Brachybacterium sp. NBEC-018 TaxID=2996004 RepID=UPI0021753F3F|nr:pyruvate dehydrogenase (acetyl-transferring), homodimeric type [Brachybacterium sp. NBEC-018]UVY82863.1 pyruvate dehydrogenase (acetyl-transferring), homodimeric type [Brachybacterium sp. NBEC-018]
MSSFETPRPIGINLPSHAQDPDPEETREWLDSFDGLVEQRGEDRASEIVQNLIQHARHQDLHLPDSLTTDYVNTIPADQQPEYPGDLRLEREIRDINRWNAAMIVHRAQRPGVSVGGHLSSYASIATMYEVGFNHFFRGRDHEGGGDHVFFQGHASPGIYARAFLQGRLTQEQLDGFRQEKSSPVGMPSYPHPRAMQDFWEFPTVSMGIGPVNAIEQASFDKYLHNRGLKDTSQQHTWAFLGDGEMDEVESRGALHIAAKEHLDNLTFVVNCNLQRLDGPVRGNGKIIQELEAQFRGAGWNVIKVIWGAGWDPLLEASDDGALIDLMNSTPDGDFQTYRAENGGFIRDNFFGRDPRTKALVEDMSDDDIWWKLNRGGHDTRKIHAAFQAAMDHKGQPTVILAHTIKGYRLGKSFAGRNATHQMKKFTLEDLKALRDTLNIPFTDEQLEAGSVYDAPLYVPEPDSEVMRYFESRRAELGAVPSRRTEHTPLPMPEEKVWEVAKRGSGKQEIATTMALVRLLKDLLRDKQSGKRWVPIIPDEARTFGMDSLFPTAKIYNPDGQNYLSVDRDLLLAYKESVQGQIKHMGINEISSTSAFTAAGTSYSTHDLPMIPLYIFYSMFGFQRTGDFFWAAGDQMAKGFVIGATAGKTTLAGEGLQHMDGHSPILAYTNPGAVIYDPAYGYEIGHILRDGLQRMYGEDETRLQEVFYYLTVYNEPIVQPAEPEGLDVEGLLKGMYLLEGAAEGEGPEVQLLSSGVGVPWARHAREILAEDWGVRASVWSVTSWTELRKEALEAEKHNLLHPEDQRTPWISTRLQGVTGPFVASSDYDFLVPDLIREWVPGSYGVLGADGWGFSDTRPAARRFLKIDAHSMVVKALQLLAREGKVDPSLVRQAIDKYDLTDVNAGQSGSFGGES